MSRARLTYTVCYVLMLLVFVAFPFIVKATQEITPQTQWSGFHPWFGPVPHQLQAEEWNREADDRQGVIFTFTQPRNGAQNTPALSDWQIRTATQPPCPSIGRSNSTPSSPG